MIDNHVRLAVLDDIPVLLKFAKNFHMSSPYRTMKFDKTKGEKFLKDMISGGLLQGVVLVGLKDKAPIGFLVGAAHTPVFSSSKTAMELGWWVEPEYRKTRTSYLLYRAYEDWAVRVGCSYVQGAYLPGISPELDEFYRKRGYVQVESSYLKTLKF